MPDTNVLLTFIIVSFCFALVLILAKDNIVPPFRRNLAITALVMVLFSFLLGIYLFLRLGSGTMS